MGVDWFYCEACKQCHSRCAYGVYLCNGCGAIVGDCCVDESDAHDEEVEQCPQCKVKEKQMIKQLKRLKRAYANRTMKFEEWIQKFKLV
jgi:hypothetical protein